MQELNRTDVLKLLAADSNMIFSKWSRSKLQSMVRGLARSPALELDGTLAGLARLVAGLEDDSPASAGGKGFGEGRRGESGKRERESGCWKG